MRRYRRNRGSIVSSNPNVTAPSIVRANIDVVQSKVSFLIPVTWGAFCDGMGLSALGWQVLYASNEDDPRA